MATPDWKAIKITKDKVRVVSLDKNSPIFRRPRSMKQQITPVRGDNLVLDRLVDLLRISPKDKLIFKVHLISMFLEAYPIPMMVFDGSAGSLKTTISSTVKMIVDPNGRDVVKESARAIVNAGSTVALGTSAAGESFTPYMEGMHTVAVVATYEDTLHSETFLDIEFNSFEVWIDP